MQHVDVNILLYFCSHVVLWAGGLHLQLRFELN